MPECERYEEMISAYLDNELSADEAKELTDHLQSCPSCSALMKTYSLLFAPTPRASVPNGFTASVMGMTSAAKAPQRARKRAPIIRIFAAAAACLLLIGAAYPMVSTMLNSKGGSSGSSAMDQNTSAAYSTTVGSVTTGSTSKTTESTTDDTIVTAGAQADTATNDTHEEADESENISGTATLVIDGAALTAPVADSESEDEGSRLSNGETDTAIYIYGQLPDICSELDFTEIAESNGTAFIAEIDEELAKELIAMGHKHDSGVITHLIWYPD